MKNYLIYSYIALILLEGPLVAIVGIRGIHYISAIIMIAIIVECNNSYIFKKAFTTIPVITWAIWILYSLVNWLFFQNIAFAEEGNPGSINFIMRILITPLFFMVIVYYEASRNFSKLVKSLVVVLFIYTVIGMLFQSAATGTTLDERGSEMLGNGFALMAVVSFFILAVANRTNNLSYRMFIMLGILTFLAILFGATRKAFGGWIIIAFFYIIEKYNFKKPVNILLLVAISIVGYYFIDFVVGHTLLGERLNLIEDDSAKFVTNENNLFLKLMGDRAFFYIYGWDIFVTHPINGIGLTNFPVYTRTTLAIHSEYMVQLCEGGVIGSFIYLIFNCSILYYILSSLKSKNKTTILICLGGFISILFISFFAWTYAFSRYFLIYGMIMAICRPLSLKRNITVR